MMTKRRFFAALASLAPVAALLTALRSVRAMDPSLRPHSLIFGTLGEGRQTVTWRRDEPAIVWVERLDSVGSAASYEVEGA